jgi:hypothetical protein
MAQTGFTPILIYSSSTTTNAPAVGNLTNSTLGSELAINITDGKLFYKDNANAIQVIGWKTTPATAGGTGQTSYTTGDLLYASSSTALSKLADVATGNALISGGVGVAPSWGKIGLTTHVSGTLPIANGGTNSTATPTNGGIGYGTGTAYAFSAAGTSGNVLVSGGAGAPTWTGGPTFTATTKVSMAEAYLALEATAASGKLWYLISGGGGNVSPGYFCLFNGTNGNKVMSIAPSTTEQFTTDTSGNFNMLAGSVIFGAAAKGITGSSSFSVTIANAAAGNLVDLSTALPAGASGLVIVNGASAGKTTILAQRDSGGYYSVTELGTQPRGTYITSITLSGTNLRITNSSGASETFTGKVVVLTN